MNVPLEFRKADPAEYDALARMVIDSFEPITWFRRVDEMFGPPNGLGWRARWQLRMKKVFENEEILVGVAGSEPVAFASGTIDPVTRVAYIDLLAVDLRHQRHGYGREMLRGMVDYVQRRGALHVNLDCLTDNHRANELYRDEGFQEASRSIRWYKKL